MKKIGILFLLVFFVGINLIAYNYYNNSGVIRRGGSSTTHYLPSEQYHKGCGIYSAVSSKVRRDVYQYRRAKEQIRRNIKARYAKVINKVAQFHGKVKNAILDFKRDLGIKDNRRWIPSQFVRGKHGNLYWRRGHYVPQNTCRYNPFYEVRTSRAVPRR